MAFLYLPLVQMQHVQLQQTIYQHLIKRSKLNSSLQALNAIVRRVPHSLHWLDSDNG